jgi:hypothetical protein
MNTEALIRIIQTSEQEKRFVKAFVDEYGFDTLINHLEAADISSRAKQSILHVNNILENNSQALTSLAALTEIPEKFLTSLITKEEFKDFLIHPEKCDIDSRQLFRFRNLNEVYSSYLEERSIQGYERLEYLQER